MSDSPAFNALQDLAARARGAAIELPAVQAAQTHSTALGFSLLEQRFVAVSGEVSEMMRAPQVTRVPGVKNFVVGVGNVRGRLMIVVDLALFFGQASSQPRNQRRVLAVEDDDNENYIGFMVDESYGMQHFPSDSFEESSDEVEVNEMFTDFVRGSYLIAGTRWPVLSLRAVAADPRLEKLAIAH